VNWKSEERDEEDEAAALRRIWGRGEAVRKEGKAEASDDDESMVWLVGRGYYSLRACRPFIVVVDSWAVARNRGWRAVFLQIPSRLVFNRTSGKGQRGSDGASTTMASKRKLGESPLPSTRSSNVTTASLSNLLSQLTIAAAADDHEKAVKVATDVLSADPTNAHAAKQKALALIKLDKYKDALAFLDEATFLNSAEMVLERGFCLYKLGKGDEAIEVLKGNSGRAVQHVLAQNV
jgi:tetratricopeptide (TPR) repeat protein